MKTSKTLLAMGIAGCMMAASAIAAPINGTLNFFGGVAVSQDTIDFLSPAGGGTGTALAELSTNTGFFAPMNSPGPIPNYLTIKDLTGGPVVGAINVVPFLYALSALPGVTFDLTNIFPGDFTSAQCSTDPANAHQGNTCTPANSPFSLTDTATGSTISLNVSGTVNDGVGGSSPFVGLFTQQLANVSYEAVLNALQGGGAISTSYSASFTASAVPEPSSWTMLLAGAGMLGISLFSKRRAARG